MHKSSFSPKDSVQECCALSFGLKYYPTIQGSINVNSEKKAQLIVGTEPVKMSSKILTMVLGRYKEHVIMHDCYLQLQEIHFGEKLVNI